MDDRKQAMDTAAEERAAARHEDRLTRDETEGQDAHERAKDALRSAAQSEDERAVEAAQDIEPDD